jgi:hypothetical protein
VARSRVLVLLMLAGALALVGWWLAARNGRATAPAGTALPARVAGGEGADVPAVLPGNAEAPPAVVLSPAEREALLAAEAERSVKAAPPATYKGIDGRQHAFRYPDPVAAESAERTRQARREQLLRELEADPAGFARAHGLSLKQVQWIVDGETDFPDALLEP